MGTEDHRGQPRREHSTSNTRLFPVDYRSISSARRLFALDENAETSQDEKNHIERRNPILHLLTKRWFGNFQDDEEERGRTIGKWAEHAYDDGLSLVHLTFRFQADNLIPTFTNDDHSNDEADTYDATLAKIKEFAAKNDLDKASLPSIAVKFFTELSEDPFLGNEILDQQAMYSSVEDQDAFVFGAMVMYLSVKTLLEKREKTAEVAELEQQFTGTPLPRRKIKRDDAYAQLDGIEGLKEFDRALDTAAEMDVEVSPEAEDLANQIYRFFETRE